MHVRFRRHLGLAGLCHPLDACRHRHLLDRFILLFRRARPWPAKAPGLPKGAMAREWQVHGGGFYHIQKYLVAPERMPEHLIWFKWESYMTWISRGGASDGHLLGRLGALSDRPAKMELAPWQAIAISAGSLSIGWLVYTNLCKSPWAKRRRS